MSSMVTAFVQNEGLLLQVKSFIEWRGKGKPLKEGAKFQRSSGFNSRLSSAVRMPIHSFPCHKKILSPHFSWLLEWRGGLAVGERRGGRVKYCRLEQFELIANEDMHLHQINSYSEEINVSTQCRDCGEGFFGLFVLCTQTPVYVKNGMILPGFQSRDVI